MLRRLLVLLLVALPAFAQEAAVTEETVQELVTGNSRFAFSLYEALEADGNLFFSPYSLSSALAMTYAGARGETAQEMADTLGFTLSQETLHPAFAALEENLLPDTDAFRLTVANALWGQEGYGFNADFLTLLETHYGAAFERADFENNLMNALDRINAWVEAQTEGRIQDIVSPETITSDTRLVLANAIYFKADWLSAFEPDRTQDLPFHLLDGTTVEVPTMTQTESQRVMMGDGYAALELPYVGDSISMLILLPDAGEFRDLEAQLDEAFLAATLAELQQQEVRLELPRFTFEASFSLGDTLAMMGMPAAFTPYLPLSACEANPQDQPQAANFSGMDDSRCLIIGAVLHKAFVQVDEEGTEAAAATVVGMMRVTSMPAPPLEFLVDRPFVFLIRDNDSGSILFMGRVLDPR